ncbi:MAG: thymidine kinase [Phycisphaerae bacterium]
MGSTRRDPNEAAARTGAPVRSTPRPGVVTLITGCMFSGKTTELLRLLRRVPPDRRVVVKHACDDRYERDAVVSHGGDAVPARRIVRPEDIPTHVTAHTRFVAIDEAHFLGQPLPAVVQTLAAGGVDVVATALDRSSWGTPFPVVDALRALADRHIHRQGTCARCGAAATHSQRLTPILDGRMIGGADSYEPRCAACWTPPPEDPSVVMSGIAGEPTAPRSDRSEPRP